MATKPNYFKLGLFILIAIFMLVAGIVLFGSGVFAKEKIFFESYFPDPGSNQRQPDPCGKNSWHKCPYPPQQTQRI